MAAFLLAAMAAFLLGCSSVESGLLTLRRQLVPILLHAHRRRALVLHAHFHRHRRPPRQEEAPHQRRHPDDRLPGDRGGDTGGKVRRRQASVAGLLDRGSVLCLFMLAFGWSWGPLGWTVPSEIFALETRSAGPSITVAVNLFFTFIIAQAFLSLLCAFKFTIFIFFAAWIAVMTTFVYVFLPETKGVPIEEMVLLWSKHGFWKKVMPDMPLEDGWGPGRDSALADINIHK